MTTCVRGKAIIEDVIVEDAAILWDGETILAAGASSDLVVEEPDWAEIIETTPVEDVTYIPGLIDVHCHGGGGESFPNAETAEQAMVAVLEHRRHGTTSLVASAVTASPEVLLARAETLAELGDAGEIAGIHFEGPFVSCARCGAQDPTYIIPPDAQLTKKLIEVGRGHVVTMTIAPEEANAYGAGSAAEVLIEGGALPSWGHTDSDPHFAREALEYSRKALAEVGEKKRRSAQATVTHLFNGMRPLHHRDPGPILEFIADAARGGAIVEMICDGVHLDPAIVRSVYDTVGRDAAVLITDAMAAAGMPDGEYQLGPQAVVVSQGVARLAQGDSIAGGTAHLIDCVKVAVEQAGIPLVDAVYMASAVGARILGVSDRGELAAGKRADIVAIDSELRPVMVWRGGAEIK